MATEICADDNEIWATITDCIQVCNGLPTEPPYSTAVEVGNSLACRLYHTNLATSNPATHCQHVAGISVCVD